MMGNIMIRSNLVQEILLWHLIDDLLETPKQERLNLTDAYDTPLLFLFQDRRELT